MDLNKTLKRTDWLALERTKLANERTFLAYFRTFLVIVGTGITILKIDLFLELKSFGFSLITIAILVMIIGVYRFFKTRKNIKKYYA